MNLAEYEEIYLDCYGKLKNAQDEYATAHYLVCRELIKLENNIFGSFDEAKRIIKDRYKKYHTWGQFVHLVLIDSALFECNYRRY